MRAGHLIVPRANGAEAADENNAAARDFAHLAIARAEALTFRPVIVRATWGTSASRVGRTDGLFRAVRDPSGRPVGAPSMRATTHRASALSSSCAGAMPRTWPSAPPSGRAVSRASRYGPTRPCRSDPSVRAPAPRNCRRRRGTDITGRVGGAEPSVPTLARDSPQASARQRLRRERRTMAPRATAKPPLHASTPPPPGSPCASSHVQSPLLSIVENAPAASRSAPRPPGAMGFRNTASRTSKKPTPPSRLRPPSPRWYSENMGRLCTMDALRDT